MSDPIPEHPHELDLDVEHLAATLRRRRAELAEASVGRIGQGEVVHELTTRVWVGIQVPAVLCAAAADPMRIRPAAGPVTCRRCRSRRRGETNGEVPGQANLWE